MSLDQDGLNEKQRRDNEPAELTRTELTRRELKAAGEIAKAKSDMGLPLSDSERLARKTGKLLEDLRQEKS